MPADENKVLAHRFIQIWVPGNSGLVDELAAPDISHLPGAWGAGA